jgi:hypothetical protein
LKAASLQKQLLLAVRFGNKECRSKLEDIVKPAVNENNEHILRTLLRTEVGKKHMGLT